MRVIINAIRQFPYLFVLAKWFWHSCAQFPTPVKWAWFRKQYREFTEHESPRFSCTPRNMLPMLNEASSTTNYDAHYIYHPAWAARILAETSPRVHVDISSSLHFCTLVSAFLDVEFYDYRPAHIELSSLVCGRADLLSLHFPDNSVCSLSCMHVVEHIGLGRYGDPIVPDGDLMAMRELKRVLAPEGTLLVVVPISGRPRIEFNAHRIYAYAQMINYFSDLELVEFALIPDDAASRGMIRHANPAMAGMQNYGCGCFHFRKTRLFSGA